jgi:hypothetical protein
MEKLDIPKGTGHIHSIIMKLLIPGKKPLQERGFLNPLMVIIGLNQKE